jgi:tRNA threonylcarbamoyladenosine biosynthesis protein TsaE
LSSIEIGRHVPPIVETPARLDTRWNSESDTQAFAARLATCAAITLATLTLHGDLGAGKTTFVRHLLRALGVQGRIKSPTYAVVEPHSAIGCPLMHAGQALGIWHFDFYRFTDPREWEDAGFRELFASPGLKLVEWPERAAGLMPAVDAELHIEPDTTTQPMTDDDADSTRHVRFTAFTPTGRALLAALAP